MDYRYCRIYKDFGKRNPQRDRSFEAPIINWVATKEYNEQNRPYLHMYVELERDALLNIAMSTNILKDLLSTYFKYIDQDYRDLKKILGMDPLQVTIFTCGTFEAYEKRPVRRYIR